MMRLKTCQTVYPKSKKERRQSKFTIFSKLLDVSFEQILSTGECGISRNKRLTNYTVAQSHSEKEWRSYIEKDQKPLLNPDKYGKTVLDYAIEYRNYEFLKFLMDNNYIWFDSRKDKAMVSRIAKSSDRVLNYFIQPFQIRDHIRYKDGSKRKHTFVFPYISQLLDMLVENNSSFLEKALKKAITYNDNTLERLRELIEQSISNNNYYGYDWTEDVDFFTNGSIISFRDPFAVTGIITNVIHVTKKSEDVRINELIEKLIKSYEIIRNIKRRTWGEVIKNEKLVNKLSKMVSKL